MVVLIYFIRLKGFRMSKKSLNTKYLEAASKKAIDECCAKLEAIKTGKRKPKPLKIEPIIPTVVRCLEMGKSAQKIADIAVHIHGISISKKTVLRFAKTLPTYILK